MALLLATIASSPVPCGIILTFGSFFDLFFLTLFAWIYGKDVAQHYLCQYVDFFILAGNIIQAATILYVILQITRFFIILCVPALSKDDFPAKPMLFPCQVHHTRMIPKKHVFRYSFLWAGIPVGWKGSSGGILSADVPKKKDNWFWDLLTLKPGNSWWAVDGADYMERGAGGLEVKLRNFLESQNIDPEDYPHAYLFTAARFFNYASNPVSMWNLYSASKELKAMILEVNNTFDERRIYFLKLEPIDNKSVDSDRAQKLVFHWEKDFYVSVFNGRHGSYDLSTFDPLFPFMASPGPINTRITNCAPDSGPTVVARICSTSPGIDPSTMFIFQKIVFLSKWWWVGLATIPRTIFQAQYILFRKKISWSFRPEPKQGSIPRRAEGPELLLEELFFSYLSCLVSQLSTPVKILYTPAGIVGRSTQTFTSPSAVSDTKISKLDIRVLTPLFYSRLLYYATSSPAEILLAESQLLNQTISLSDSELVASLFTNIKPLYISKGLAAPTLSWQEKLAMNFIGKSAPTINPAPVITNCERLSSDIINPHPLLQLTPTKTSLNFLTYVTTHNISLFHRYTYLFHATKLQISRYLSAGSTDLLVLQFYFVRFLLAWYSIRLLFQVG